MKKSISIILVLALGLVSGSYASEGTWTRKTNMPTARWELSSSVVDGKIYAIGGASRYGSMPLRTVEEYDPATDTWTTKSEMPTARQGLSTSVVDGKIYAIGGAAGSGGGYAGAKTFSTVEEYDPATDTWTTKSEMPTARGWHSAGVVDGRIYVIGGSPSYPFSAVLTLEVYEPATDTWTRKGDIPCASSTSFASVVDGKIYTFGGYVCRRSYEYDPVTDTWTRKADMPTYRVALFGSALDGKIYAIGGQKPSPPYPGMATVEAYDPATDTWTTEPDMPTPRWISSTSVVDGKIYAIGGMDNYPAPACGTVEEYDPNPLIVDFNGDGIVDAADICLMLDYWLTDESFYDIAPRPFGDGIVDIQDLILLAEYLFGDLQCVAHFMFDEAKGSIADDSARNRDGTVQGDPQWLPAGGVIGGALQFDGFDDYVKTVFMLNPADGALSIFAWIKGGAPGQVIVSQMDGVNWLLADPSEGNLMTELKGTGRAGKPLQSQTNITDDNWHRIGFVWDGSHRTLYVDGIVVAKDTQANLEGSNNGLYIGCGKSMEADTYFSGLIDDVRIYDVALTAEEIAALTQ